MQDRIYRIVEIFLRRTAGPYIGQTLRGRLSSKRDSDVLARIGGEELALLLPETDLAQAHLVAERLCRDVGENPLIAKSDRILTTISIGVVVGNVAMIGIADLMRAVDQALYDAKGGGRNRVVCSGSWIAKLPRAASGGLC